MQVFRSMIHFHWGTHAALYLAFGHIIVLEVWGYGLESKGIRREMSYNEYTGETK
jgi:hypothetical protein